MIKNYINDVRNRPEPARKAAAFFWTVAITVLIGLVWLVNMAVSVDNETELRREAERRVEREAKFGATTTESVKSTTTEKKIETGISVTGAIKENVDTVIEGGRVIGNKIKKF